MQPCRTLLWTSNSSEIVPLVETTGAARQSYAGRFSRPSALFRLRSLMAFVWKNSPYPHITVSCKIIQLHRILCDSESLGLLFFFTSSTADNFIRIKDKGTFFFGRLFCCKFHLHHKKVLLLLGGSRLPIFRTQIWNLLLLAIGSIWLDNRCRVDESNWLSDYIVNLHCCIALYNYDDPYSGLKSSRSCQKPALKSKKDDARGWVVLSRVRISHFALVQNV